MSIDQSKFTSSIKTAISDLDKIISLTGFLNEFGGQESCDEVLHSEDDYFVCFSLAADKLETIGEKLQKLEVPAIQETATPQFKRLSLQIVVVEAHFRLLSTLAGRNDFDRSASLALGDQIAQLLKGQLTSFLIPSPEIL